MMFAATIMSTPLAGLTLLKNLRAKTNDINYPHSIEIEMRMTIFCLNFSFNYREGLVLHNIRYEDGNKIRPLFYRISLSEMVNPFNDR